MGGTPPDNRIVRSKEVTPWMSRLGVTGVFLLVAAGGLWLWFTRDDVDRWQRFGGERQGWLLGVPPGWRIQPFTHPACRYLGYRDAVVITSTSFVFRGPRPGEPEECFGRFIRAGFPSDGVALAIQPYGRRIGLFAPECESPPVGLTELESAKVRGGPVRVRFGAACPRTDDPVPTQTLRVWIGREATPVEQDLLERALVSFHFLRDPDS